MEQKPTLVEEISTFITRFVFLPNEAAATVASLFIIHTWTKNYAYATPYMYLHSPEKQSGKTKALEVFSLLVKNPLMGASITDAALFRAIEQFDPTLILDEVDTIFHGAKNEAMRAVLNSGYRHSGHVWRVVKGDPERFKTYCCKLLAGINNGALPDTIKDRSIQIRMRRKPKDVKIEPFYMRDVRASAELESILTKLERFAERHEDDLWSSRPEPIAEISDREWEITEPLIVIAGVFGMEDQARAAVLQLFAEAHEQQGITEQQQLLIDIAQAFHDNGMTKISSRSLIEYLGNGWTGKKLASQLSCYGIQPHVIRISNEVARGYEFADFKPIFESYLKGDE